MPNHLVESTSPYLKQHQDNPVDWYPWGDEAIQKAKKENKPIFLSIGYAACHWCHVMAHESFEDPQIAQMLNDNFIAIKVDREERPDLDDIYMQAVVMLTGQGGWPLSIFLTPELKPFYGGTYFPPEPRYNMPSFTQILDGISNAWQTKTEGINKNAEIITESLQSQQGQSIKGALLPDLDVATQKLIDTYDWKKGGWGTAPKFPQPMLIEFLIQRAFSGDKQAYELVEHALEHLSMGGLYDLVGGGFHRYSTDASWLIPHFEKMLYDNAQLALAFIHGYALTKNPYFRWIAEQTLDFIQRELTDNQGGFYASLDADTPDGEGRYYSWRMEDLKEVLSGEEFSWLNENINIRETGNFEDGLNVLQLKKPISKIAEIQNMSKETFINHLGPILIKLRSVRNQRPRPKADTKIITEWNALAITAFAQAGRQFNNQEYLQTARSAGHFILEHLNTEDGHLKRNWSQGQASQPGTLADYAGTILTLHQLYEINFSPKLYEAMQTISQSMQTAFASGAIFYNDTAQDVPHLILQPSSLQDSVTPSGNAMACHSHWLLYQFEGAPKHNQRITDMLLNLGEMMTEHPHSFGYWLKMADLAAHPTQQIALISPDDITQLTPFIDQIHRNFNPYMVVAAKTNQNQSESGIPAICLHRAPLDNKPSAFICENFTCHLPITDIEDFKKEIN
jgi:uncharacterized protein YyaL (SSP411 family)